MKFYSILSKSLFSSFGNNYEVHIFSEFEVSTGCVHPPMGDEQPFAQIEGLQSDDIRRFEKRKRCGFNWFRNTGAVAHPPMGGVPPDMGSA